MTHAKRCASGKTRHTSLNRASVAAHAFARELNRRGELARTLYAYRCDTCAGWHLTRQGMSATLVLTAAPEHLQRWAMPSGDAPAAEVS